MYSYIHTVHSVPCDSVLRIFAVNIKKKNFIMNNKQIPTEKNTKDLSNIKLFFLLFIQKIIISN